MHFAAHLHSLHSQPGGLPFSLSASLGGRLAVAVYLAGAFTQVAFLAHDGGHRQAFRSRKANDALLLVTGNLGVGIASGWWFGNHNRHHAHPNNTELDPDVNLRFFAYSDGQTGLKSGIDKFVAALPTRLCIFRFSLCSVVRCT